MREPHPRQIRSPGTKVRLHPRAGELDVVLELLVGGKDRNDGHRAPFFE
jgi:hypothetical protein